MTRKLTALLRLSAAVPLAVAILSGWLTVVPQFERALSEHLTDQVAQTARTINQFMLGCLRELRFRAGPGLVEPPAPQAVSRKLAEFTYAYPYLHRLTLVDSHGVVRAGSHAADVGQSLLHRLPHLADLFAAFEQADDLFRRYGFVAHAGWRSDADAVLARPARRLAARVKVAVSWLDWWQAWEARWWTGEGDSAGTASG
ncbi:MAG: hypothetical protein FJ387_17390 [Verrucomicrobia bacterium]|nr:hypothetical protein [Verrucomicrobiota bacterium]